MGKSGDALYFSGDQLYNTAIKRSRLLQFDYHYLKGAPQGTKDFHINAEADDVASELQKATAKFLNHKKIPETAYNTFKDFDNVEKYVKVGGKALTIAGFVFDAYDFGTSVYTDLNDEDRKLGKTTVSSAAGIAGSWAGGAAGAKLGRGRSCRRKFYLSRTRYRHRWIFGWIGRRDCWFRRRQKSRRSHC